MKIKIEIKNVLGIVGERKFSDFVAIKWLGNPFYAERKLAKMVKKDTF